MPTDLPDKKWYQLRRKEIFIPFAGPFLYGFRMREIYGDSRPQAKVMLRLVGVSVANSTVYGALAGGALLGLEYLVK